MMLCDRDYSSCHRRNRNAQQKSILKHARPASVTHLPSTEGQSKSVCRRAPRWLDPACSLYSNWTVDDTTARAMFEGRYALSSLVAPVMHSILMFVFVFCHWHRIAALWDVLDRIISLFKTFHYFKKALLYDEAISAFCLSRFIEDTSDECTTLPWLGGDIT